MDKQPIVEGAKWRLYWVADESGAFRAQIYYDDLDIKTRARFVVLFNRMAKEGQIRNRAHFRPISRDLAYFKVGPHRLTCFEDDARDLLLVSGFVKKTNKDTRYRRHIKTAERLRDQYLQRKGANDEADPKTRA